MEKEGLWFNIGADNTDFSRTAKDTNNKLSQMSQNVKAFSKGITASFAEAAKSMLGFYSVAKAGTLFQDLIAKNDEFNKSMKEVGTLSADVAKNLDAYKKQILEMSTQIPIAANDAAKALYQINSAGHTGADGMKVLEVSAKAAIGGVTETVTAADTITTVLNAYKMSADEASSVSDKLFTAVKLGKTTMSELGASIAQVAPIAASFGVSIDEVLAAVASLTKSGTPTAQAMTQIRAAIVAMSDKMGVGVFQTLSLQDAMKKMRESFADDKLKDAVGTIEAYNGILGMTGANAKTAADDLQAFADSAGAANEAYSQIDTGKGSELVKLQNNVLKEMSGLTEQVSESIEKVAHALNEAFDTGKIEEYVGVVKDLVIAYGAYKAAAILITGAQKAYNLVMEEYRYQQALANIGTETFVSLQKGNAAATATVTAAQAAQSTVVGLLSRAWQTLTTAMAANPFGIAAIAISAMAFATYKLINAFNDESKKLKGVTAGLDQYGRSVEKVKEHEDALLKTYNDTSAGLTEMMAKLSTFNGSKADEKKLVEECNNKYGDAMGYYSSVSDWYKVLEKNSAAYCDQMVLEIETRQLANQIAENEQKRREIMYNKDGTQRLYDTNRGHRLSANQYGQLVLVETMSEQEVASQDLKNLRQDNERLKKRMMDNTKRIGQLGKSIQGSNKNKPKNPTVTVKDEDAEKKAKKEAEEAEKRKKLQEQIANELLRLRQQNNDAEVALMQEGAEKKIAEIENDYAKERAAVVAQAKEFAKENAKAGIKGLTASVSVDGSEYDELTAEQADALTRALELANKKRLEMTERTNKEELDNQAMTMAEYLSQYGNIEEKRKAITEKYQTMIDKAKTDGEKKSLRKQMEAAINTANFDELKKSIDWDEVFNNLESIATSRLADLKEKMHDALLGGEIRPEDAKVISDRIAAIEAEQNKRRGLFDYSSDTARKNKQQLDSLKTQLQTATTEEQKTAIKQKIADKERDIAEKSLQQRALELSESFGKLAGDITGVADIFNELGLGDTKVGKIANNVANAATSGANAVADFASGNYVGAALNAIKAGVSIAKMFDSGNMEDMNESIEELTDTNRALQSAMNDLKDAMEEATVAQASQTYEQQKRLLEQMQSNASSIMQAEASKWESGSHSINSILNSDADFIHLIAQASRITGTRITSSQDFLGLGADTLKQLRTQDPELYAAILKAYRNAENKHTGEGVDDMIEDYIEQFAGAADELENVLKEKITGMTFDSLYDNFVSSLMDMNKSAEDFGDDFTRYLMQAVLNAKVGELMQGELQKFYDEFAVANEDGTLSSTEVNRLRESWDGIVKAGIDLRDGLAEVTGYDASTASSAKTKGFNGMSQEVGNELNGRFASLQMSAGEIMVTTREIAQTIEQISIRRDAYLNDILEAHALTNSWLESTYRLSRQMLDQFGASLDKIDKNTSNL